MTFTKKERDTLATFKERNAYFRFEATKPIVINGQRTFSNISMSHPHLNDIVEVESGNQGERVTATHYGDARWAKNTDFRVLHAEPVAFMGYACDVTASKVVTNDYRKGNCQ